MKRFTRCFNIWLSTNHSVQVKQFSWHNNVDFSSLPVLHGRTHRPVNHRVNITCMRGSAEENCTFDGSQCNDGYYQSGCVIMYNESYSSLTHDWINVAYKSNASLCTGIIFSNDLLYQEWVLTDCNTPMLASFLCTNTSYTAHLPSVNHILVNSYQLINRNILNNVQKSQVQLGSPSVRCPQQSLHISGRCLIFFHHKNISNIFIPLCKAHYTSLADFSNQSIISKVRSITSAFFPVNTIIYYTNINHRILDLISGAYCRDDNTCHSYTFPKSIQEWPNDVNPFIIQKSSNHQIRWKKIQHQILASKSKQTYFLFLC